MSFSKKYNEFRKQQELDEQNFINEEYLIMRLALNTNGFGLLDRIIESHGVKTFEKLRHDQKIGLLKLMERSL